MRRFIALIAVVLISCPIQGCFLFGNHDGQGYHKNFAYETPERVSAGHAHRSRSSRW